MGYLVVGSVSKSKNPRKPIIFKKVFIIVTALVVVNLVFFYIPSKLSEENGYGSENVNIIDNNDEEEDSNFPIELSKNSLQLIQNSGTGKQSMQNTVYTKSSSFKYRKKWSRKEGFINNRPKKILLWNSYWESTAMWHKIFYEVVYKKCPQSNCVMTVDKTELEHADAVLFHLVDIAKENYSFPINRNPDQIWIGMTYEPPYILKFSNLNFTRLNGIFNRTMSYRSDSDVVVRHGTFVKINEETAFPNYMSDWIGSQKGPSSEKNYAEGKRRMVSWFVSSRGCKSQSHREKYVKELQKHIPVDIFGACGPFKCGTQKTMRNPYKVEHDDCYLLVSVAYKFVLAFENSICQDYVTEKLYNHLKLNVVPIVFGGANYSEYAPPYSYIDASKYTPKELGDYLQILDKNDTLYNQYFEWKQHYYIASHDGIPLACDLCEQLNSQTFIQERKVYDNFDEWLESGCSEGWYPKS